jgi:hypothetical protein
VHIQCICGFRLQNAAPWRGRGIAVEPMAGSLSSSLVVASDMMILAQCKGVVMAQLESPLGVENGLVRLSPEAHASEGLLGPWSETTGRYLWGCWILPIVTKCSRKDPSPSPSTLWASHIGDLTQCWTAPRPRYYP